MPPKGKDITQESGPLNLLRPLLLLSYSAYYIIPTILDLLLHFQIPALLSFSKFKDHWFSNFWAFFGPRSREYAAPAVLPLLENSATGVCLDVGPGNGQWLDIYSRANNPSITKIYGVEPNHGMHKALRESAVRAGLGDVYEIVGCGAQELSAKAGFQSGSIDTIITVQSLCSIPTPETIIEELYPLLKPGGKWLMYEHVKTKYRGDFVAYWQRMSDWKSYPAAHLMLTVMAGIVNIIWPHFFGGCDICRPTDEWVRQAGEWDKVELKSGTDLGENCYDTMPHVIGTLTKKKLKKLN